ARAVVADSRGVHEYAAVDGLDERAGRLHAAFDDAPLALRRPPPFADVLAGQIDHGVSVDDLVAPRAIPRQRPTRLDLRRIAREDLHLIATCKQRPHERLADETRASGNDHFHVR